MPTILQIKRTIGAVAAPAGANHEGELAIGFPGVAGATSKPTLYANDGAGWRTVNPAITIGSAALPGGTAGSAAGIGAAWTNLATKPAAELVVASFAGTTYLRIAGTGANDADWTSLGSATVINYATSAEVSGGTIANKVLSPKNLADTATNTPDATATNDASKYLRLGANGLIAGGFLPAATDAEIKAGTLQTKVVTPKGLKDHALNTPSTGTAAPVDAGRLVALDATGFIDNKFLHFTALTFRGQVDVTAAYVPPVPTWNNGDFAIISTAGTADATWNAVGITGAVSAHDLVIFDGTNYVLVSSSTALDAYLPLTGTSVGHHMADTAVVTFDVPATPGLVTRLDGGDPAKSRIENFTVDGGTY